eukprot:6210551-Prymnesium_polylepis.1
MARATAGSSARSPAAARHPGRRRRAHAASAQTWPAPRAHGTPSGAPRARRGRRPQSRSAARRGATRAS